MITTCKVVNMNKPAKKRAIKAIEKFSFMRIRNASIAVAVKDMGMEITPAGAPERISINNAANTDSKIALKKITAATPPNTKKNQGLITDPPAAKNKKIPSRFKNCFKVL